MSLVTKARETVADVRTHWSYPAKKKYIPYKELAAYSIGGIGVQFVAAMAGVVVFTGVSMVVGASIGIDVADVQTLNVISTILGFLLTPLRAMILDNTRSKKGKFRPYILYMGVPTTVFSILLVYAPYESMGYWGKFTTLLVLYNVLQLFSPFYTVAYNSLVQVMSPNSDERNWVIGVSSVIFSLAPSITNFAIPMIGPMDSLKTYRIAVPIFCIIGVGIGMLCYFGTKEKIIVSKQYKPRVRFLDGMKKISKNKYFWIIYGSQWILFFNALSMTFFQWAFYYGTNGNNQLYGVLVTLLGTASLPGMLFGPALINKFGSKAFMAVTTVVQIASSALMLLFMDNTVLMFICFYLKFLGAGAQMVWLPSMKADALDYQQYKTGDRLEGFMEQTGGLIGTVVALGTGYIPPLIQHAYGLYSDYTVLYNPDIRNPLLRIMIICVIIDLVMGLIPFLAYNLSNTRHRNMIKVLKIRAMFTDYENGQLSAEDLVDTVEEVREAQAVLANGAQGLDKKAGLLYEGAKLTVDELHKYEGDDVQKQLAEARRVANAGSGALRNFDPAYWDTVKQLPNTTQREKTVKKYAKKYVKSLQKSARLIKKYYSNTSIQEPDHNLLRNAVEMPETTKAEKTARKVAIRKAEDTIRLFEKAAAPYVEAKKFLREAEAYSKYNEILAKYEEACETVRHNEEEAAKQRALEDQEKKDAREARQAARTKK